jgi:hypothetical protein
LEKKAGRFGILFATVAVSKTGFLAHGNDPFTAHQRAVAVLQGLIYQQATMVAYAYDFALLGLLFALCLPLVALVRSGGKQPGSHVAEM